MLPKWLWNIIDGFALLVPSVCASVHMQGIFKPPAVDTVVSFFFYFFFFFFSGLHSDLQDQSIDQNSVKGLVLSLNLNLPV